MKRLSLTSVLPSDSVAPDQRVRVLHELHRQFVQFAQEHNHPDQPPIIYVFPQAPVADESIPEISEFSVGLFPLITADRNSSESGAVRCARLYRFMPNGWVLLTLATDPEKPVMLHDHRNGVADIFEHMCSHVLEQLKELKRSQ